MYREAKYPRGGGSRSNNRSESGWGTAAGDQTIAAAAEIPLRISVTEQG